jgi:hypothetical protein
MQIPYTATLPITLMEMDPLRYSWFLMNIQEDIRLLKSDTIDFSKSNKTVYGYLNAQSTIVYYLSYVPS